MWYILGIAFIVIGTIAFFVAFANTNITAPQESDPGNKFIWPSIGTVTLGVGIIAWKLFALLIHWIAP